MTRFNKAASVKKFNISVTKKEKVTGVDKRVFYILDESGRKEFRQLIEKQPIFLLKEKYESFIECIKDQYERIGNAEMCSMDVMNVFDDFCIEEIPALEGNIFQHCCGVVEESMGSLAKCDNAIMIAVAILTSFGSEPGAAMVFTDNNTKKKIHGYLSTIVAPISLGKNPNSGKNLYMWVVTRTRCKDFLKNAAAVTTSEEF